MLAKVLMCPCFSESFQEKGNSYQKKKKKKKKSVPSVKNLL